MLRPTNIPSEARALYDATAAIQPRLEFRVRGAVADSAETPASSHPAAARSGPDVRIIDGVGETSMDEIVRIFAEVRKSYAGTRQSAVRAQSGRA
jgi:hypothetical protein